MEAILSSSATISAKPPITPHREVPTLIASFPTKTTPHNSFPTLTFSSSCYGSSVSTSPTSLTASFANYYNNNNNKQRHWMVVVDKPPLELSSKPQIIDYYVKTLERVFGSDKEAQMCIYHASCDTHFGFCCDIDEEHAYELAGIPGVLLVKPDPDFDSMEKDYSHSKLVLNSQSSSSSRSTLLFPAGTTKYWLVQMERPAIGVMRKPQVVDYYVQVLMRVLGNEKDAQMCIYHISWQSNYGFCCELDEESAQELAGVPGVLSIQPDENFGSDIKNYGAYMDPAGKNLKLPNPSENSSASNLPTNVSTKKLFVTGLSFYTSEKTLRAAFEGFGELVEVKIIMDKISKRSKGYAFVQYTTEEAASAALKEMNGKIINGWMITVDVAKTNPPKYSRGRPRPAR
ncbi:organelle RRM domain-containing 1, chloroplastic isoform X1 [Olea europaea subsp. europaea]|uniref:Organelle RRM domain-containing 1, chloroplastic isoform X1 n=1 Tax=Olea europaea subsp. europaea TaxID=158383 RepID=A0A8S0Q2Q4_OLEEU|nr:organelle RRM domain-containing 1, chloroplastic isoform X1 [Olea europaea subsp. europaea]